MDTSSLPTFQHHGVSRRGVMAGSAATLALLVSRQAGFAQPATPAESVIEPNMFALEGSGTSISYATSSFVGVPTFSYTGPDAEVSAEGDEIGVEQVVTGGWPFGNLVSVFVDAAPDAWARSLTLVLPDINLVENGNETVFTTFAVLTTHHTNIGGPAFVQGPLQEYEIIALDGTASAVLF